MTTEHEPTMLMEMEPKPDTGLGVVGEALAAEREDLQPYLELACACTVSLSASYGR